ncbi:MAG: hypothetical protein IT460_01635 [Planctomycetes bacterium]|nr:hypothetical protein [Planctomycetota bacterium]
MPEAARPDWLDEDTYEPERRDREAALNVACGDVPLGQRHQTWHPDFVAGFRVGWAAAEARRRGPLTGEEPQPGCP